MPSSILKIEKEDVSNFWRAIEESIPKAGDDPKGLAGEIIARAEELGRRMAPTESQEHCLKYKENSCEYLIWSIGLLAIDWSLENLRRKTRDGHCNFRPHPVNCKGGADVHRTMYEDCKSSFRNLLNLLETRPLDFPDQ